jgi:hypothetical protein
VSSGLIVTILAIGGVMAVTVVVAIVAMRRFGAQAVQRADELRDDVEMRGEQWVIPLESASYRGATHTYGRVKGNGVAGLTDHRVVFEPLIGKGFTIPLARVTGVKVTRWFLGAARASGRHLVLTLDDGNEVGFFVRDQERWLSALAAAGVPQTAADADG